MAKSAAEREQLALTIEPLDSCDDAAASLRQAFEDAMNARLDDSLRSFLSTDSPRCVPALETPHEEPRYTPSGQLVGADAPDASADDKYIYRLESNGLRIFSAQPADQTAQLARVKVPGRPNALFVRGDRALVVSAFQEQAARCVGCESTKPATALLIYDVSDRSAPALLRRLDLRGERIAARQLGDVVHVVIGTPALDIPLAYLPPDLPHCSADEPRPDVRAVMQAFDRLRDHNLAQLRDADFATAVPRLQDDGTSACQLYRALDHGASFTNLVTLDLSSDAPPTLTSVQSQRTLAYVSEQRLYLAADQQDVLHVHDSTVHAFALQPSAAYLASGLVTGRMIDATSMDEWHDALHIATTTDLLFNDPHARNLLSVMQLDGGKLQVTGQLTDIIQGADVRAVRFDGGHAFLTTYAKGDPLHVFELKEHAQPTYVGPIASTQYWASLRMLDDQHLLAVGYDGPDPDAFTSFTSIALRVFDLLDLKASPLQSDIHFDLPWLSTALLTAGGPTLNFSDDKLAIPLSLCAYQPSSNPLPFDFRFGGAIIYNVSAQTGFRELGRIYHAPPTADDALKVCEDWNGQARPQIQRSLFTADDVYAFTSTTLHVQDLHALGTDLATVPMLP